jgi:hypothetical protein
VRILAVLTLALGCTRRSEPAQPRATVFCRGQIRSARLPAGNPNGRWGVELDIEGPVLKVHEARFSRLKILPNGQAWSDVLEQCLSPAELHGIHLDPEAGSLHAWVETDDDKDRWQRLLCRAIEDHLWLDRCLASVDRSRIDD